MLFSWLPPIIIRSSPQILRSPAAWVKFSESIYVNSENGNYWLDGGPGEVVNDRIDLTGDPVQSSGLAFKITVPGQGVIFHEAGRIIFENSDILFQAGPKDFTDENLAALCAALTP